MRVEQLTNGKMEDFKQYCRAHRNVVDDSFLSEEDLNTFRHNEENPTFLLVTGSKVVGAVSLIVDDYFKRGKRGRFRIFHSELETHDAYQLLLQAIIPHTKDINHFFLFLRGENQTMRSIFDNLGFEIERYSYVLDRPDIPVSEVQFPLGYELETFQFERDEEKWCEVRNPAFATLAGSETPVKPEQVMKMRFEEGYLEEGIKILYHDSHPVGIARMTKEEHEGEDHIYIHLLAVKPEYQKAGLGRNLLRTGLQFGKDQGLPKALITVNAENEKAVNLYLSEGFQQYETMICYRYNLK